MKKIVITEFMDETAVESLRSEFDVLYDPTLVDRMQDLERCLVEADAIIIRNRTQVRGELLKKARKLKAVGRLGVGLDNIDMQACQIRGIDVFPATGANDEAVAEYVITVVLMLFRRAYFSFEAMTKGEWPRTELMGCETSGKLMGLVGYGGIARETAVRAKALGMEVIAFDPFLPENHPAWQGVKSVALNDLLKQADVVSLHVPLTDKTHHLINESAIGEMKPGALLINAARGGVVDDSALIAALKSGRLGGAALDVYENEPLSNDLGKEMVGLKNLILTPHIAGVTVESNVRVSAVTAENIRQVLGD
ncbi:hydroxyacid dehydrogenase [bacterium]|nr:hydroxyacid dehydrogenase [bacterium]